jgi:hypothetical protein
LPGVINLALGVVCVPSANEYRCFVKQFYNLVERLQLLLLQFPMFTLKASNDVHFKTL